MRLLAILAAIGIGLSAITAVNAEGTSTQTGTGNSSGARNMDTSKKGNPNTPSAAQISGMSARR